ncbi:MAG: Gfo/Idh/MocA family oxidoreductase [Terriglobia bacterium]|jgi:predicted dehydrogenase
MEHIRIGMIGCGLFGESHLRAYQAIPRTKVTAVYDPVPERAGNLAEIFQIPHVCSSVDDLCQLKVVDAVDVVSPEELHLEPVLAAIHAGKEVFVEKPFATDLDHCSRMIRAASDAGRILMVGHILRFETKFVLLKQEVESGRLGNIVSMHARRNRPSSLLGRYGRTHPVLENCIHDIDLMLWYVGERVRRVRGFGRKATGGKYHDAFWGVLEFEGGALGIVETIWLLPQKAGVLLDDGFQLIGDRGVGNINLFPGALSFWRDDGFEIPDSGYDPRIRGAAVGALRDELMYFCECVRNHRRPEVITPREAKNAVRLSMALVESGNLQRDIDINDWD